MKAMEIKSSVRVISRNRTDQLGFGTSALNHMKGNIFTIEQIENYSADKMFYLNGVWVAHKDCELVIEETLSSVKPPTLVFDATNLI